MSVLFSGLLFGEIGRAVIAGRQVSLRAQRLDRVEPRSVPSPGACIGLDHASVYARCVPQLASAREAATASDPLESGRRVQGMRGTHRASRKRMAHHKAQANQVGRESSRRSPVAADDLAVELLTRAALKLQFTQGSVPRARSVALDPADGAAVAAWRNEGNPN
jgi:hypothetical protein